MNTAGRKRRKKRHSKDDFEAFDHELIRNLVDESKFYLVETSTNALDKSVKVASFLTKGYLENLQMWDNETLCTPQNFICDLFL